MKKPFFIKYIPPKIPRKSIQEIAPYLFTNRKVLASQKEIEERD
jgi:hypothetical protein